MNQQSSQECQKLLTAFSGAAAMFGNGMPVRQGSLVTGFHETLTPLLAQHGENTSVQAQVFDVLDEMTATQDTSTVLMLAALAADTSYKHQGCNDLERRISALWKRVLLSDQDQTTIQKIRFAKETHEVTQSPSIQLAASDVLDGFGARVPTIAAQPW